MITYQTAYLKAYYPLEFFVACMNIEKTNLDKIKKLVDESHNMDIKIKRPNILKSMEYSTIENNSIRLGLSMVKYIGLTTARAIVLARQNNGKQGILGLSKRVMSTRVVQVLKSIGAFSNDDYIEPKVEQELLGFSLSSPTQEYDEYIHSNSWEDNNSIMFGGMIENVRKRKTKNGKDMAFVDIAYGNSTKSVVLFEEALYRWDDVFEVGKILMVYAKKQRGYDSYMPQGVEVLN